MLKYFQNKYAMSEKGAKDLLCAIIWTVVMDIGYMVPVVLGFKFLDENT
jgi:ATP-binding cassette subfamily B protein IrtB